MMYQNDDELDRALFALPLEPLPAGLRESILAATIRPATAPAFTPWEIGGIGVVLALITWLCMVAVRGQLGLNAVVHSFAAGLLHVAGDLTILTWLGVGVFSAIALTFAAPTISFARSTSNGSSR